MQTLPSPWLLRGYLLLFLALPWSVEWSFGSWALLFPAEPMIAMLGIGLLFEFGKIDFKSIKISVIDGIVISWIIWLTVTAATSTLPLVSWKYWLVEIGHIWVFYGGMVLFPGLWRRVFPLFVASLAGVAIYALVHFGLWHHFRVDQSPLAASPFFNDHTLFGAVLGLGGLGIVLMREKGDPAIKFIPKIVPPLLLPALLLTFSRAAWLSVLLASLLGAFLVLSKKWRPTFLSVLAIALAAGLFFQNQIAAKLAADVSSHERLNRYSCATRMAADHPWTGFGPGTFQFQYLAYQRSDEMTRISVTHPIAQRGPGNYGRGGGAHSEYFQAWAEMGWPGLLLWVALVAVTLATGFRAFFGAKTKAEQRFVLLTTLSLLTFFLHALVNNFLHDARVAALVWGQMAVLEKVRK